jgi:hypothetical protein
MQEAGDALFCFELFTTLKEKYKLKHLPDATV